MPPLIGTGKVTGAKYLELRLPKSATPVMLKGRDILSSIPKDHGIGVSELIALTHPHLSLKERDSVEIVFKDQMRLAGKLKEEFDANDIKPFLEMLESNQDFDFKAEEITSLLFSSLIPEAEIKVSVVSERSALEIVEIQLVKGELEAEEVLARIEFLDRSSDIILSEKEHAALLLIKGKDAEIHNLVEYLKTRGISISVKEIVDLVLLGLIEFKNIDKKSAESLIVAYRFGEIAREHKGKVSSKQWDEFTSTFYSHKHYTTFLAGLKALRLKSYDSLTTLKLVLAESELPFNSFSEYMHKIVSVGYSVQHLTNLIQESNLELSVDLSSGKHTKELLFLLLQAETNSGLEPVLSRTLIQSALLDSKGNAIPFLLHAKIEFEGEKTGQKIDSLIEQILTGEDQLFQSTPVYEPVETSAYAVLVNLALDHKNGDPFQASALQFLKNSKHAAYAVLKALPYLETRKERKLLTATLKEILDQQPGFSEARINDILRFFVESSISADIGKKQYFGLPKKAYKLAFNYFDRATDVLTAANGSKESMRDLFALGSIWEQRQFDMETLLTRSAPLGSMLMGTYQTDIFIQALQQLALRSILESELILYERLKKITEAMLLYARAAKLPERDLRYIPYILAAFLVPADRSIEELKAALERDPEKNGLFIAMNMVQSVLGRGSYDDLGLDIEEIDRLDLFPELVAFGDLLRSNKAQIRHDRVAYARALLDELKEHRIWTELVEMIDARNYEAARKYINTWIKERS